MDNKDNDNKLDSDDSEQSNIDNEENNESERQINPVGSVVVQQSQKPGITSSQKSSGISIEGKEAIIEQNITPSDDEFSGDGVKSGKDSGKNKGPTTTTTSKTYTKQTTDGNITETTTEGTTSTTTSSVSNNPQLDDMLSNSQKVSTLVASLNTLRNSSVELGINYEELVYFQRMVRPLIDSTYFLALSAQGTALTAQALNNINIAKPKQVEASVDLAYDIIKELDCLLQVLKCRLDTYLTLVENDGCNTL